MSGSVSKIFIVLIVVVMCVIIGAFAINILLPNVMATLINAIESMIWSATGMSFDFNADGTAGNGTTNFTGDRSGGEDEITSSNTVSGYN